MQAFSSSNGIKHLLLLISHIRVIEILASDLSLDNYVTEYY